MESLILFLTAIFIVFLFYENITANKNRKAIKHVIYVNGTRGKSTVTRLIDSALRAHGYKVFCKTTGTIACYIDVENNQTPIKRRGRANIKEQLFILKTAAEQKADILVCECMAVDPYLQKISQHKMLKADIGVITNVRLDHTDEMGETLEEICNSLANTIPSNGVLFTGEQQQFETLFNKAKKLNTKCFLANANEDLPSFNFAENLALALMVAEHLGVKRQTAINGMLNFKRDPFDLSVHRLYNGGMFINALSANDVQSTYSIYNQVVKKHQLNHKKLVLLINNRPDRGYRAKQMIELAKILTPCEVWLIGSYKQVVKKSILRSMPSIKIKAFNSAKELPFSEIDNSTIILAAGNIAVFGEEIMGIISREGEIIG